MATWNTQSQSTKQVHLDTWATAALQNADIVLLQELKFSWEERGGGLGSGWVSMEIAEGTLIISEPSPAQRPLGFLLNR